MAWEGGQDGTGQDGTGQDGMGQDGKERGVKGWDGYKMRGG